MGHKQGKAWAWLTFNPKPFLPCYALSRLSKCQANHSKPLTKTSSEAQACNLVGHL